MIQQVDSIILIPKILRLAKSIPDIKEKVLEKMLIDGINDAGSKILVDKKDNGIRGFMFASIEGFRGEDVVFIQATYVDPKYPNICQELITQLNHWAQEKDIRSLVAITSRNTKAIMRKYKFKHVSSIMKREV